MEYLRYFESESAYTESRNNDYVEPWVSLTDDGSVKRVDYNKNALEEPLTVDILSGNTMWIYEHAHATVQYVWDDELDGETEIWEIVDIAPYMYRINGGEWQSMNNFYIGQVVETNDPMASLRLDVSPGDSIQFKATNQTYYVEDENMDSSYLSPFVNVNSDSLRYSVRGNILSMFYGDDFLEEDNFPEMESSLRNFHASGMFYGCACIVSADHLILPTSNVALPYAFSVMFFGCSNLTTAPDISHYTVLGDYCYSSMFCHCRITSATTLPATTLAESCYSGMFMWCNQLTAAPSLPATTLEENCYSSMFYGCTGLTSAPELPATTLAYGCYSSMFYYCRSLTTAPALPATTLAEECYSNMFQGCTSLISGPELPATALTRMCYYSMFSECSGLTIAPVISAVTLSGANDCCFSMFEYCTSLVTAPGLNATDVAQGCYGYMFVNCTGLTSVQATLPVTTLEPSCYNNMFRGCTSLTTAPELPATTLKNGCYYQMFSGCTSLNYVKCLATSISATNSHSNWLAGVAATGTFVKKSNMSGWPSGANGIPNNWTTLNA